MSKRKQVKTSRERAASARHEFEAEAGTTVGIVGAAIGAVAGAVIGGITGAALAKMSDHHEQILAAEDRELERELAASTLGKSQNGD